MGTDSKPQQINSAETAFNIVEILQERKRTGVTELADLLEIAPSTAHAYLNTMRNQGYVVKDNDTYALSLKFLDTGSAIKNKRTASRVVSPVLESLAEESGEIAWYHVEERGQAVVVDFQTSETGVRVSYRRGKNSPLYATAAGKAILAKMAVERREAILDEISLEAHTANTITDMSELYQELEQIREDNIAYSVSEYVERFRSVATPLMHEDVLIGAVCIAGPGHRLSKNRMENELADLLLAGRSEVGVKIDQFRDVHDVDLPL